MEGAARPGLTSTTWSALGDVNRLAGTAAPELCQCALKLGEEVGELCRAVRKLQGQPQDPAGRIADVGDEAADALIQLMSIVNRPVTRAAYPVADDFPDGRKRQPLP